MDFEVRKLAANKQSTEKHNTYHCIYTVYLLMMGYRFARNM